MSNANNNDKRAFTVKFPAKEAEAVIAASKAQDISITLLFRMMVRQVLMQDPIKYPTKQ